MLTYDALIDEARERGMPPTKIRGILREYLQILILKQLYKTESGKKLMFTGGTYLRLVHNLKRFSEDLDFNTNDIAKKEFGALTKKIANELKRMGPEPYVEFAHWGNVYVSKMIFPKIESSYNVVSKYSKKKGIIIKIETNKTKKKIGRETQMVSGFGEFFPCVCTEKGVLFADKIDALGKKNRGRHVYDIMFMLSKKFPVNKDFLKKLGIKKSAFQAISDSINKLSKPELKKQAEVLRPFLFDESDADLVINAQSVLPQLMEKYG